MPALRILNLLSAKGPPLPKSILLYSILAVQLSHRAYSAPMPSIHPLTVSSTEIEPTCMPFMAVLAGPPPRGPAPPPFPVTHQMLKARPAPRTRVGAPSNRPPPLPPIHAPPPPPLPIPTPS